MKSGLNVDYINPFIEAVVNTLQTMCAASSAREKVYLKGLGVIGATGQPTQPATWMVNADYNF